MRWVMGDAALCRSAAAGWTTAGTEIDSVLSDLRAVPDWRGAGTWTGHDADVAWQALQRRVTDVTSLHDATHLQAQRLTAAATEIERAISRAKQVLAAGLVAFTVTTGLTLITAGLSISATTAAAGAAIAEATSVWTILINVIRSLFAQRLISGVAQVGINTAVVFGGKGLSNYHADKPFTLGDVGSTLLVVSGANLGNSGIGLAKLLNPAATPLTTGLAGAVSTGGGIAGATAAAQQLQNGQVNGGTVAAAGGIGALAGGFGGAAGTRLTTALGGLTEDAVGAAEVQATETELTVLNQDAASDVATAGSDTASNAGSDVSSNAATAGSGSGSDVASNAATAGSDTASDAGSDVASNAATAGSDAASDAGSDVSSNAANAANAGSDASSDAGSDVSSNAATAGSGQGGSSTNYPAIGANAGLGAAVGGTANVVGAETGTVIPTTGTPAGTWNPQLKPLPEDFGG